MIEILAKLVFSIFIIIFNMMKLLLIFFIMKMIAQINIFKSDISLFVFTLILLVYQVYSIV